MYHFGFASEVNADRAGKTLDKVGITSERRHEVGYHYFYFATEADLAWAIRLVQGEVDASLEDGEWG